MISQLVRQDAAAFVTAMARSPPLLGFSHRLCHRLYGIFCRPVFPRCRALCCWSRLGGVIGASHISLFPAWAGAVMGSVLGDWISWWIGFHYHHKIVHFRLFRRFEDQIEKALHLFHNWGTWAIFIGRFMGPFRATVPLVAGMSELEFCPS